MTYNLCALFTVSVLLSSVVCMPVGEIFNSLPQQYQQQQLINDLRKLTKSVAQASAEVSRLQTIAPIGAGQRPAGRMSCVFSLHGCRTDEQNRRFQSYFKNVLSMMNEKETL